MTAASPAPLATIQCPPIYLAAQHCGLRMRDRLTLYLLAEMQGPNPDAEMGYERLALFMNTRLQSAHDAVAVLAHHRLIDACGIGQGQFRWHLNWHHIARYAATQEHLR